MSRVRLHSHFRRGRSWRARLAYALLFYWWRFPSLYLQLLRASLSHPFHPWLVMTAAIIIWAEAQKKNLIQHCERSELHFHLEWKKKLGEFLKNLKLAVKQCYYLDKSLFWSKISGKCQKLKCHILNNFQTLCCIREGLLIMGDEDLIHVKHPLAFTNKSSVLLYAVFI